MEDGGGRSADHGGVRGRGRPTFFTQADALLRKNLTYQKRNIRTNIGLIFFPVILCVLLLVIQKLVNNELAKPEYQCGCQCVPVGSGSCQTKCGIEYSTVKQVSSCPIYHPQQWPVFVQIPAPEFRAVVNNNDPLQGLPDQSCRENKGCPFSVLYTGAKQSFAEELVKNFFPKVIPNKSDPSSTLLGTDTYPLLNNFIEPAFGSDRPIYYVQAKCFGDFIINSTIQLGSINRSISFVCAEGLSLWRNNSSLINKELFTGYRKGNAENIINEFAAAYDFLNSEGTNLNMIMWYNSTYRNNTGNAPFSMARVSKNLNLATNAYLEVIKGAGVKMPIEFVKEMPKSATVLSLDFSSLLGPLFFTWVIELLFPVFLSNLVYEKQKRLRIMMKMHGLGDGPYWFISYAYFLLLSIVYMFCFVFFGSIIGLNFFRLNNYSLQLVFYFIFVNLQISLAFLIAPIFSDVRTSTVVGYIYVFGSGLLGVGLLQFFLQDSTFPRVWIVVMEIVPGFSLYRGLYEFATAAFQGSYMGTPGLQWSALSDSNSGMKDVLIIIAVEWVVLLVIAYYLDQVVAAGSGVKKHPLFFLKISGKKNTTSMRKKSLERKETEVLVDMEKPDVAREREVVEQLLLEPNSNYSIISDNLQKVYPGKDGNPQKYAVHGLSLALSRGECFGMLGPNGAGKTTFINMMIGLMSPTSGTAYVQGFDIKKDMDSIYTSMGVCPQHDLIWEKLSGREHLLFYGRLKNLKGAELNQAVEESLKSANLFNGGVGDKLSGKYSGGMKRRLSVAISLIGNPQVVYMDEPSTGLDPASRNNLWTVVKRAKRERAIILTTHSMEEAEVLCDRIGIFVDGSLQCIGNPKELKARYGGSYVFTMTTDANQEAAVETLVNQLSPSATKVYHISGTQKFELPKNEVRIADVFNAVDKAKRKFSVQAWGLADTTLEDVFIKVARGSQSFNVLP